MNTAKQRQPSLRRLLLTHEIAFLLLVAVAGLLGAASAYFWQQSSQESIRLNYLATVAQEIRSDVFRQLNEVALATLREDPSAPAIFAAYTKDIKERFNELRRRSELRDEGYAIQDLQQAYGALRADMSGMFRDPLIVNRIVRSRLIDPGYQAGVTADFEKGFDNFRGLIEQKLTDQEARLEQWTRLAPYVVPIPLVFAVILLLVSRASLINGFVRPIHDLVAGVRRLGDGNQRQLLEERGVAEIVELARGLNAMNSELRQSQERLLENERQAALGALVPVVAHNIRNPLASIRATVQVLDHHDSEQELADTKRAVIDTVDRLGRWVTALVSYLHPLTPQYRLCKVSALLLTTKDLLQQRFDEKEIDLQLTPWDELVSVMVDADLMEQALYALLSNALDASERGASIILGIETLADSVAITITDRGGGIPFKPQPTDLEPGPTTKRMGTGLGIPIAYKVCKAHRWELSFDIEPNVGTRVRILAPRAESSQTAAEPEQEQTI